MGGPRWRSEEAEGAERNVTVHFGGIFRLSGGRGLRGRHLVGGARLGEEAAGAGES